MGLQPSEKPASELGQLKAMPPPASGSRARAPGLPAPPLGQEEATAALLLSGPFEPAKRQVHRVGAEEHLVSGDTTLLKNLAHLVEEVFLQLQVLEDRLDHHLVKGDRTGSLGSMWSVEVEMGGGGGGLAKRGVSLRKDGALGGRGVTREPLMEWGVPRGGKGGVGWGCVGFSTCDFSSASCSECASVILPISSSTSDLSR